LEVRLSMVDALRDVERRIADNFEASLRAVALLRSEIRQSAPHYASSAAEPRESFDRDDAIFARLGDVFRGARPVIEERFGIYPDIVSKAATVGEETPLLDVGTGRGEWLDILKRRGIPAIGCELNGILVEEGRAQGLSVESADMLAVLRARQPSSLGAITAFHVVEHVTFEYLLESLREAVRVLVPGGIVIFETPDPRNLIVASRTFYLDPTHLHPVPHELLSAVLECFGFTDIRVLDLHVPETPAFPGNDDISAELNRRFSAAQDYAIVARTPRG
jgi:O-antigen chain-terminating methyltransferase